MSENIEIKKQIKDENFRWYVLSVVSAQEHIVIENLMERIKKEWLEDEIVDFMVPTVPEVSYKKSSGWEKKINQKKLYPGYVFVKSKMNDKIWYVIRNTPWVRLIVGAETRPVPLTDKEFDDIMKHIQEKTERAEHISPFKVGDIVTLTEWEFKWTKWAISEIDTHKWVVYVNVEILGRLTPMMVPFEKVERIN